MKETFYFQHDYNARTDPKLQDVLIDLGAAGLGVYWCIIEQLYEQGGRLPMRSCKCIAFALHVQCDKVKMLINNYGLFQNDGEFFWSDSVLRRLATRKNASLKRKEAALARWNKHSENQDKTLFDECTKDANAMQVHQVCNANAPYKGKEKKEEENIKENIQKKSVERFSPPPLEEVKSYIVECGYTFSAERFCDFYSAKGWMVGKNKMKDWRAAVRNWARGEKERFAPRSTTAMQTTKKVNTEWEQ